MALVITPAVASAVDAAATDAAATAYAAALGANAVLQIRTGAAPGPSNPAAGTLLASVTIASWTAGTGGSGTVTGSNPGPVTVAASGDAAHFRLQTAGGTAILEGTVGQGTGDLSLDATALVAGGSLDLDAPVLTVPVTAATS